MVNNKTISKRIRGLEEKELILIKKQGRLKTAYISEKGKKLINKRRIVCLIKPLKVWLRWVGFAKSVVLEILTS